MTDIEKEYELAKQIFSTLTQEELHNTIKRLYAKKNRYVNVTGVDGQENLTEAQVKQIIGTVEKDDTLKPYSEALVEKTLVSDMSIKSGEIVKTEVNEETNAITYTLSIGIKVHYKFVNKEKDKVSLNAISYGGTSLLNDDELPSASLVGSLVQLSGLGDFTATDLKKVLAGKKVFGSASVLFHKAYLQVVCLFTVSLSCFKIYQLKPLSKIPLHIPPSPPCGDTSSVVPWLCFISHSPALPHPQLSLSPKPQ